MQHDLKSIKNENSELQKEKSNLDYQLRKVRDDISTMVDKADRKKQSLLRDIDNLKHQQLSII
jgi:F0F1-type ATP synthase membrane subunit b/b'